jgi:type 1 glutamine amidotransferase
VRSLLLSTLTALLFAAAACGVQAREVKVLIITGDEIAGAHKWKETAPFIKEVLTKAGHKVVITETPSKDLTPDNLAKYDVLLLNYRNTPQGAKANPASVWSDDNKKAFLDAIKGGKGLYVYHFASSAFTGTSDFDKEFEKAIAGGWRTKGYHGKKHEFTVTPCKEHPITAGLKAFKHGPDELYQNSVMLPDNVVLVTAYSDKSIDAKNTGKDEPVVWVAKYGKGRVCENVLGHDVAAMKDPGFQALLIRGVEWAGTGEVFYKLPDSLKGGK